MNRLICLIVVVITIGIGDTLGGESAPTPSAPPPTVVPGEMVPTPSASGTTPTPIVVSQQGDRRAASRITDLFPILELFWGTLIRF